MSTKLLQYVAECFHGKLEGMHCLGAVSGSDTASPSGGVGSRGGVMSVVRALGVLVCEGRLQGPPRGYKEGPHCAAPLQAPPNDHVCEKDNYLCGRYLVLVREIGDRITIGSALSVEVLMCTDCPCGLARATFKPPVSIAASSISQWQHPSDILLEYWSISVVPSKCPEMMNSQGLYQAVRSRLHFSQVAAWWSRSNGTRPSYVTTRIVTHSDDNIRKFRESPIEHTFPLAGIGDGNSIKVTVWALPRMEEVPTLNCSLHPTKETDDECAARALTPTKNGAMTSSTTHTAETMVLPVLVDDRLQTACDKPGKHHCHCEDEESGSSPPSPSIRPNGERKRRRSLPCGPSFDSSTNSPLINNNLLSSPALLSLPSLPEQSPTNVETSSSSSSSSQTPSSSSSSSTNYNRSYIIDDAKNSPLTTSSIRNYQNDTSLEGSFHKQISIEDDDNDGNDEKRYKPSNEQPDKTKKLKNNNEKTLILGEKILTNVAGTSKITLKENLSEKTFSTSLNSPLAASSSSSICNVHQNYPKFAKSMMKHFSSMTNGREITSLMSKLSLPTENNNIVVDKSESSDKKNFQWYDRVTRKNLEKTTDKLSNDIKTCNLALSQREFNEVLAVLRSRTPTTSTSTSSTSSSSSSSSNSTTTTTTTTRQRRSPNSKIARRRLINIEQPMDDKTMKIPKNYEQSSPCPIHRDKKTIIEMEKCHFDCKILSKYRKNTNTPIFYNKDISNNDEKTEISKNQQSANKADVLLGAILRNCHDSEKSTIVNEEKIKDTRINENMTKTSLNKSFSGLRQLFQRDCGEKSKIFVGHTSRETEKSVEKFDDILKKDTTARRERIKRKIDFNNFSQDETRMESYERFFDDTRNERMKNFETIANETRETDELRKYTNSVDFVKTFVRSKKPQQQQQRHFNGIGRKNDDYDDNDDTDDDDDETIERGVPSAIEQKQFRRSFENAASMVFHSRTGLPLTSSPAPLRRGHCCFDYDSTLNSVSSKRSALFELNTPPSPGAVSLEETDREIEISADGDDTPKRPSTSRIRPQSHALLGSFEESALNGRLEPVSTVHGFTAELGASGSFCPKHRKLPVTVFFYTLGDNDKVSTPYLAHINLGKKGYQVPRSGTIQVTLLNPLGTVVKMFVVLYDLSDMPPRSHTFLRQRTLRDKTLRYLVHLRFMSGKSGRIYLHTDIRMIICRKSDVDTASDFGSEPPKELRSYIHGPTNPKFSPRC